VHTLPLQLIDFGLSRRYRGLNQSGPSFDTHSTAHGAQQQQQQQLPPLRTQQQQQQQQQHLQQYNSSGSGTTATATAGGGSGGELQYSDDGLGLSFRPVKRGDKLYSPVGTSR
jgi:hypothetical protein